MDPITIMMMLAGATATVGTGLSVAGKMGQSSALKRSGRMQQWNLMQNLDGIGQESAFEQDKVADTLDQVQQAQTNYYAGGNIDQTWGSPALMSAESAASAEMDKMLVAARAGQKRADVFGQIAGVENQVTDRRRALDVGIATDFLNLAQTWLSLGMSGQKAGMGKAGGAPTPGGGPMNIGTVSGNWRAPGNFSQGYYT
jgi:hypothetical protein